MIIENREVQGYNKSKRSVILTVKLPPTPTYTSLEQFVNLWPTYLMNDMIIKSFEFVFNDDWKCDEM